MILSTLIDAHTYHTIIISLSIPRRNKLIVITLSSANSQIMDFVFTSSQTDTISTRGGERMRVSPEMTYNIRVISSCHKSIFIFHSSRTNKEQVINARMSTGSHQDYMGVINIHRQHLCDQKNKIALNNISCLGQRLERLSPDTCVINTTPLAFPLLQLTLCTEEPLSSSSSSSPFDHREETAQSYGEKKPTVAAASPPLPP